MDSSDHGPLHDSDDLPGPGHTLGKLYNFAGRHLEVFVGKMAERLGKGPRVTAHRITRRRAEVIAASLWHPRDCSCWECCFRREYGPSDDKIVIRSPASIKATEKKINRDCRRLLKYVGSRVPSTHKQAMDDVLDLSVGDYYLRSLLKSMDAPTIISDSVQIYSRFSYNDFDDLLLSSSRRALISLSDTEINTLLQKWVNLGTGRSVWLTEKYKDLQSKIVPYLHNPSSAFLVMQVFRRIMSRESAPDFPDMVECTLSCIKRSPDDIEWEECDRLLQRVFQVVFFFPRTEQFQSSIADCILRFADRLPRVLGSQAFQELSMTINELPSATADLSYWRKDAIMQGIISAIGSDRDILTLELLRRKYPCPSLQLFLSRLICPLEHAVRKLFSHAPFGELGKVPTSLEASVYNEIAFYTDSPDSVLSNKAWDYANYFLSHDIFRCNMMLQALSTTIFATTGNFSSFEKAMREQCIPRASNGIRTLYRHWDRACNEIHISGDMDVVYQPTCGLLCDCAEEYRLDYMFGSTLSMQLKHGTTLQTEDIYPLIAGCGRDGKRAFIAIAEGNFECKLCDIDEINVPFAITEGVKPEDLCIELHCHKTTFLFRVPISVIVLRYAPDAYASHSINELGACVNGLDATGPFSWRPVQEYDEPWPVEYEDPRRDNYSARVITVEEGLACEGCTMEESLALMEILKEEHLPGNEGRPGSDLEPDGPAYDSCDEQSEMELDLPCSGREESAYESGSGSDSESREPSFVTCNDVLECETDIYPSDVDIPTVDGAMEAGSTVDIVEDEDESGGQIYLCRFHS